MKYKILSLIFSFFTLLFADNMEHKVIVCEPDIIHACTHNECHKIEIVNIDEIQHFEIDIKNNTLTGKIGKTQLDIENIISKKREGESYVFFGTHKDSAYDWILRINKDGNMTMVSVQGEDKSFSIYGKCKWQEGK